MRIVSKEQVKKEQKKKGKLKSCGKTEEEEWYKVVKLHSSVINRLKNKSNWLVRIPQFYPNSCFGKSEEKIRLGWVRRIAKKIGDIETRLQK